MSDNTSAFIISRAELAEGEDKEDQGLSEEQRIALTEALLKHEPWMDRLEHLIVDRDEMILRRIINDDAFYDECYKSYMKYADSQLLGLGREYIPAAEYNAIVEGEDNEGFGKLGKPKPGSKTTYRGGMGGIRSIAPEEI